MSISLEREQAWLLRDKYQDQPTPEFRQDLQRIQAGEPLDYLIGWRDFLGVRIGLEQRPFIPRAETEYWTEKVIKQLSLGRSDFCFSPRAKPLRCLDIFAGSGCIGLAVLKHLKFTRVTFSDSVASCRQQICRNLDLNNIPSWRYTVIQSNLFQLFPSRAKFDCIFANPPYVAERKLAWLQQSVYNYEPHTALFAGKDGLNLIRPFLRQAPGFLVPGGRVFLEFSPEQKKAIAHLLRKNNYSAWQFRKDQFGRWRWVEAIYGVECANK